MVIRRATAVLLQAQVFTVFTVEDNIDKTPSGIRQPIRTENFRDRPIKFRLWNISCKELLNILFLPILKYSKMRIRCAVHFHQQQPKHKRDDRCFPMIWPIQMFQIIIGLFFNICKDILLKITVALIIDWENLKIKINWRQWKWWWISTMSRPDCCYFSVVCWLSWYCNALSPS